MMKKPELLAPAGNLEKLRFAVVYGADAVYLAGKNFGLRAFAGNFTDEEMQEGIAFAHEHGVKVYVTVNIFPHNGDLVGLEDYLRRLQEFGADAIICADVGVIDLAKKTVPELPIHISTQANTVNWAGVMFWKETIGAERVVLARELNLKEICEIKEKTQMELECFVHGAMCISYSGRCLLSNYMTDRDSNKGQCAQACRWNYNLVEEKRPNEFYPIQEDERGTYIFNSQDLCLLPNLSELLSAGIDSFKIEGRMKSLFYVSTVLRAYRNVIDSYFDQQKVDAPLEYWLEELEKVSHRPYTTGFYFGRPENGALTLECSAYIRPYDFIGIVLDYDSVSKMATIEQRNHFALGQEIEFFGPHYQHFSQIITMIIDENGAEIETVPHAQQIVKITVEHPVEPFDLVRKAIK